MSDCRHLAFSVIETLADSAAGYAHVGEHTREFKLYAFCEHQAALRDKAAKSFTVHMYARGWQTEAHGTLLGSAHRLFIDLRVALGHSHDAVIRELHRGETFLRTKADTALSEGRFDRSLSDDLQRLSREVGEAVHELARHFQHRTNDGHQPALG